MRRAYTLIEIIVTVAIAGILAIGMFKALEAITLRSERTKILSSLSIDSQSALDQISSLLYDRAPMSVVGYTLGGSRMSLETSVDQKIIEWYGLARESYQAGDYSGFVDMNRSVRPVLFTPNTDFAAIGATQNAKWGSFSWSTLGLVFSGSFDEGSSGTFPITMSANDQIVFTATVPGTIYEKYDLVDSAYAVARGADVNRTSPCITALNLPAAALDNTLLLFYDYRPWNGESFCADNADQAGKVTLLSIDTTAFRAQMLNNTIRLTIDSVRRVRGGNPVHLSKQKVVF